MALIDHLAKAAPDAVGLIDPLADRRWSFADLYQRALRLASLVRRYGQPGDRVAVVGANDPAWVDAYYGVPAAGMITTFVNHRLSGAQIIDDIVRAKPRLVIAADGIDLKSLAAPVLRFGDEYEAALEAVAPGDAVMANDADVAWHIPTSGTSGRSKIVQLTHGSLAAAAATTIAARPMTGDEVYLFPFPMCHVAGYNVVMFHTAARPVVLMPSFDAAHLSAAIERYDVTHVSLAPTMLVGLLDHLRRPGRTPPPSLRCITYGSAAIDRGLLVRAIDVLGCDFSQGYGMTELSGNAVFLSPDDHRRGLTTNPELLAAAGRPGPGVALRLVDDEGVDVGDGPGEVAVRAAQVMAGYLDDEAANAATIVDGWMRTGDVGRLDADGYLYLIDRKKDIIISGGENIASREVEDALRAHPGVADVAVIGLPDDRWGEIVCAVVVPADPALTKDELLEFGRQRIGGYKKPRRVELVESLPRTASGKVTKPQLRDRFSCATDG